MMPKKPVRAFTRVPVRLHATVQADDSEPARGAIRDISLSGISIETNTAPATGSACSILVSLETGTVPVEVRARGVVLRAKDGVLAARITTLDADGFEHLQKLVIYNSISARAAEKEIALQADEHPTLAPL